MATPSKASSALIEAPWRAAFLSHVQQLEPPTFVLCTLGAQHSGVRGRTVIFRGMWADLPVHPQNTARLNPDIYQTHLPTITTDARMEKASELMAKDPANAQSGGGGPVEAVFWMPEVQTQWRLRGRGYLIGPDIDTDAGASVRAALTPHMRRIAECSSDYSWSWSREVTAHFGNVGPLMRGSFRNPPPGTPLDDDDQSPAEPLGLGQKVDDLDDDVARSNFRVVVIVPDEVDKLDLSDPQRGRRWNYKDCGGSWKETELWP
ncbi:hypothetical protein L249_8971 [Ophiocordyceps polyrhachis-furcata BCC 54312]|uniref:Pyridoxamine 5'-phosphate oxidase Alr4036 family FMN-binding domain-containing protein n=1 Tax=Ophiocordyceps polyrhachis-furcata BCC 54312 TaxID=1330021 RepID=A0A367L1X1_9HYPO|nr:hypothetical protein L249_8971 [Ophiocordyceps polyrhachis-furcata BCC 54312]